MIILFFGVSFIMRQFKLRSIIVLLAITIVLLVRHFLCIANLFYLPSYKKVSIDEVLEKDYLTDEDFNFIFKQTGVSPLGIKELIDTYRQDDLIQLNTLFFSKPDVKKQYIFFPFTSEERNIHQKTPLAPLKNGDILITFNTHTLDWRHGHAAIVTHAVSGEILEHKSIGNVSEITNIRFWQSYPAFLILRHPDNEVAEKAASYAKNTLVGIDYNLFAGFTKKDKSDEITPSGSHCSHIVWQAYKAVGVDIDFDDGRIVTPFDVASSKKLRLVQIYGVNPSKFSFEVSK